MIKFRAYSLLFLILFAAVVILSGSAAAQDSLPIQQADPAALPLGGDTAVSLPTPDHVNAVDDWSMLVYQKLQNNHWDIYVHDKSGPRRLTFAQGNNQYPSLDRGANRVAFTSDRTGDMDLYTINSDGTGFQPIFDTASDVAFPAWSPDGQRIAIQVNVDDQFEIYLINADGSSPQRLTNHAAYDGMPAWSPDGQQLAFASKRSGDYRIHLMNADGSNIRKLSSFPFSLHPTWSPDSQSVGFDADVDGDGWQELAIIGVDGTNERIVYNPAGYNSAWAGSWSPDNQALGFTEISAIYQDDKWIWVDGVIRKWDTTSGVADLIPGGKEWYVDWKTKDTIPPQTTIDPLPTFSQAENFVLRWSGIDFGGSAIKSYAVYYNADDPAEWQNFLAHTTDTQAPFPAEPGTTVQFLVRATDNAFNQEPWKQQNTKQTTFFNTMIGGMLMDNRGYPLSGVPIKSSPVFPFFPVISDWQGHFTGYTVEDTIHTLSIQTPNFMPMPNTMVPAGSDFLRDIYLLPGDTLIRNGTFETSASTPTDWATGGSLPVAISDKEFATGRYAVQLGQPAAANAPNGIQAAGTASISQKVTIPISMKEPTLSFMGQAVAGQPSANSGLRVLILPDTGTTPIEIIKPLSAQWALNWIDMTPWLDQTVTVTFEMVQGTSDPAQTYYLDDISLGSINPDLWVTLASNLTAALPGEPVAISLDYGNRGPAEAKNAVVELALPAEVTFVSATPPYDAINNNVLLWNVGDLPADGAAKQLSIVVTPNSSVQQTVVIKASIDSDTSEAHVQNNVAEATIWIGRNLFLPVLSTP